MGAFAVERDLLVLEPGVFARVVWVGQRVVSGVGSLAGGVLTLTSFDTDLAGGGVGPGSVAVVSGAALEVVERTGPTTASVSRPRAMDDDPAILPGDGSGLAVSVVSYAAQIGEVHRRVMGMLGLAAGQEGAVLDVVSLRRLEALGALHLIYASASAAGAGASLEWEKAEWYRVRFDTERRRIAARVDLDGDGVAEAVRRPTAARFIRV